MEVFYVAMYLRVKTVLAHLQDVNIWELKQVVHEYLRE